MKTLKNLSRIAIVLSLTLAFVLASAEVALAEMTVGAEFEFVDPNSPDYIAKGLKGFEIGMAQRFAAVARAKCGAIPGCQEVEVKGKWSGHQESRFILPNGFWFQVSWDPNVVEVLTKPTALSDFKAMASEIQNVIFETAKEAGLTVDTKKRAGHFNFGAHASFNNSAIDFLKFVVDFANRPELSSGILRDKNTLNSPTLSMLTPLQREALSQIARSAMDPRTPFARSPMRPVTSFYASTSKHPSKMSLKQMALLLTTEVFDVSTNNRRGTEGVHYQALGLKKIPGSSSTSDRPIEDRAVRSQRDVWDFILVAELFEARIAYLKKLENKIALLNIQSTRTEFTHNELLNRFYIYVSESGLPWERFQRLLTAEVLSAGPLSEIFTPESRVESKGSIERLISLLDLLPTSPWLAEKLNTAWDEGRLSAEAQRLILEQINKEVIDKKRSPEHRKELKRWLELPKKGSSQVGICGSIFL